MIRFRESESSKEILDTLKQIKKNNEKLLMWQSHVSPRLKCEVKIDHINVQTGLIAFKPSFAGDDLFDFSASSELYIKGKYRELLFKIKRKTWVEGVDKIIIHVPTAVKLIELRQSVRKQIDQDQLFTIKILKLTHRAKKLYHNDFNLRVLNISAGGACILVSNANKSFFKAGDRFNITDIGPSKLMAQLESEVVYIRESENKGLWNMGIQFKKKIEGHEFNSLVL